MGHLLQIWELGRCQLHLSHSQPCLFSYCMLFQHGCECRGRGRAEMSSPTVISFKSWKGFCEKSFFISYCHKTMKLFWLEETSNIKSNQISISFNLLSEPSFIVKLFVFAEFAVHPWDCHFTNCVASLCANVELSSSGHGSKMVLSARMWLLKMFVEFEVSVLCYRRFLRKFF